MQKASTGSEKAAYGTRHTHNNLGCLLTRLLTFEAVPFLEAKVIHSTWEFVYSANMDCHK